MKRVLIVDDEPEIRRGLRLKVDWEQLGLVVIGEASNGAEALERLAQEPVDIVITDMNMPVMNGVSLLDSCHADYPSLRLLVITGYEDFQYAKAAIRNQVRDYLLKPVSQEELSEALSRISQEMDEERRLQDQQERVQWRLTQYYKEMKEHFLIHTVKGELEKGIRDRAELFELGLWDSRSVSFITTGLRERSFTGQEPRTPDKLRLPFEMLCREFAATHPMLPQVFRDLNYKGLIHFILPLGNGDSAAEAFIAELRHCVERHLSFEPAIGVGQPVTGFAQWKEGYLSSLLAWNLSEHEVRYAAKEPSDGKAVLTEERTLQLQRYLARRELDLFGQTVMQELTEAFYVSQTHFVKMIFQLCLLLDSAAQAAGVPFDHGQQLWLRPDFVLGLDSVEKAQLFVTGLGRTLIQMTGDHPDQAETSVIQAAQQFINENYMYDLNLTMLADKYNYNTSYFSELFKAKVGKTFIQYLTDVRMNRAVSLLNSTSLGLWDIAELTGFSNASYFSSRFKRMYGISPSDFRQKPPEKFISEEPKK
ncbi:response regulator [Paenibacillus rigui]|uniref:DNA-binding response regulator n=1 Tax=Paenibacillus rigui TaxID=554312 RepID=A0A229UM74_9BACL|nr:response regulator [Paenibacillus rigui]OXM84483.1 DNA-binding response regulator [Paenibacillus rigui]